jgi:hypothetical protein
MKTSLLALLLTLTAPAFAQGRPTLVDYPLEVKLSLPPAQRAALKDDFRVLLARSPGVLVATRTTWSAALAAHKRQDCDVRNECLQQLAVAAGTLYALYAAVEQNAAGTEVRVTGRVVNRDGAAVRPHVLVTAPKKASLGEAARAALGELLTTLELSKLPPVLAPPADAAPPPPPPAALETPPLEPAPFPAAPPAPAVVAEAPPAPVEAAPLPPASAALADAPLAAPAPEPVTSGPGGARVAAWLAGGLAVAAAGVAVGFGVLAANERASLPADGRFDTDAQVAAQRRVNEQATVSAITGAAAGGMALVSALLFVASSPAQPAPAVSVVPGRDGAHLVVTGRFGR